MQVGFRGKSKLLPGREIVKLMSCSLSSEIHAIPTQKSILVATTPPLRPVTPTAHVAGKLSAERRTQTRVTFASLKHAQLASKRAMTIAHARLLWSVCLNPSVTVATVMRTALLVAQRKPQPMPVNADSLSPRTVYSSAMRVSD